MDEEKRRAETKRKLVWYRKRTRDQFKRQRGGESDADSSDTDNEDLLQRNFHFDQRNEGVQSEENDSHRSNGSENGSRSSENSDADNHAEDVHLNEQDNIHRNTGNASNGDNNHPLPDDEMQDNGRGIAPVNQDRELSGEDESEGSGPEAEHIEDQVAENEPEAEDEGDSDNADSDSDQGHDLSDYENRNEDEEFDNGDEPVFDGAHITVRESALAILTFILSHKLTGLCVTDLLSLLSLHCGPGNLLLQTLYRFKKYFKMTGKQNIVCHYYCSVCEKLLLNEKSICAKCRDEQTRSHFIEFPLEPQLTNLFSRPGFFDSLQFRFNRVEKNVDNIEEVYDGTVYQQLMENGFLTNPNNVSFFMYFDGVSLFKSSNFSIWPIFLTINELKYKLRTKKENTILAGIWFGKGKPNPNLFLQPIHDCLSSLSANGVNVTLPNGEHITVRAKLLGAVGDMPAKSTFMRLMQYNGRYSCFNCMSEGGRYGVGNNNTIQVFPYSRNFELRNNDDMVEFAEQALIARQHNPDASVYGVKGPTLLWSMLPNMVHCMGIDVMHGIFLNCMRTLMHLWFDGQYTGSPFSVSNLVHLVDDRLKHIKPPSSFKRGPLSIKTEFAHYKAIDLKYFFFYYSLVVLLGILPELYWTHHCLLVTAVGILCQESISHQEITNAEEIMHSYVSQFEHLYGICHLGLTFHQLLHLPMVVRNLGPAWVFSCFFYESLNGEVSRLVHGSRHVALQICSSSAVFMKLSVMINALHDGEVKALCLKFQRRSMPKVKIVENIDFQTDIVGKLETCYPVPQLFRELLQNSFQIEGGRFKYFYKLKKKGVMYTTDTYTRCKQKLSCYVDILHEEIPYLCRILHFVRCSACHNNCPGNCEGCPKRYFCIATIFEREIWEAHDALLHTTLPFLEKVSLSNEVRVFPVQCIRSLCLYMPVQEKSYIALPVNTLEIE